MHKNNEETMQRCTIIKLLKTGNKEKILRTTREESYILQREAKIKIPEEHF